MIKLFCSDLDGTLLIDNRIDKLTGTKIKELEATGVKIAFVSGRVYSSIDYLSKNAGINPYIIANNGALLKDPEGNTIFEKTLDIDILEKLIKYAERNDFHYHAYGLDTFYSNSINDKYLKHLLVSSNKYDKKYQVNVLSHNNLSKYIRKNNIKIYKIQYIPNHKEDINRVYDDIKKFNGINITQSGEFNLEIMNKDVDKWHSIEELAKYLKIDNSEVSTMGDYKNDLKMIESSGFGIAMGNGLDVVKKASDFVTKSNIEHGGAYAIDEIMRINSLNV